MAVTLGSETIKAITIKPMTTKIANLAFFLIALIGTAALTSAQSNSEASGGEWELRKTKNDIALYFRKLPHTTIPEFKAQTKINSSIDSVLAVLMDFDACSKWLHQCELATLLDRPSAHTTFVYQVINVPFARDRDIVFQADLSHDEIGNEIAIAIKAAPEFCHQDSNAVCKTITTNKHIHVSEAFGVYHLKKIDSSTVEVTWQQWLDPAGNLPAWAVRSQLDNLAFNSLRKLSELSATNHYQSFVIDIKDGVLSVMTKNESAL